MRAENITVVTTECIIPFNFAKPEKSEGIIQAVILCLQSASQLAPEVPTAISIEGGRADKLSLLK